MILVFLLLSIFSTATATTIYYDDDGCYEYKFIEITNRNMIMEWISVEDRLPVLPEGNQYSEDVLAWCVSDGITRDGFPNTYKKNQRYLSVDAIVRWKDREPSFRADRFYGKVTHWMPIQTPPKEKQSLE